MGAYINKGNEGFRKAINGGYVDKSGLIAVIIKTLDTERQYTCVTRCRRFGKSMAAKMLCAYYDKSCDSRHLFDGLYISQPDKMVDGKMEDKQFEKHLNKYPVISLDITDFTTKYGNDENIVNRIQEDVKEDLLAAYPGTSRMENQDLMDVLLKIHEATGEKFIMIIDEWDAICREQTEQRVESRMYSSYPESRRMKTEGQLPTGKGFADLVFIPRRNVDSPALLIELKCNKPADAAIDQIKRKEYPAKIAEYTGDILLVGINYDKNGPEGKRHTCKIERYTKE